MIQRKINKPSQNKIKKAVVWLAEKAGWLYFVDAKIVNSFLLFDFGVKESHIDIDRREFSFLKEPRLTKKEKAGGEEKKDILKKKSFYKMPPSVSSTGLRMTLPRHEFGSIGFIVGNSSIQMFPEMSSWGGLIEKKEKKEIEKTILKHEKKKSFYKVPPSVSATGLRTLPRHEFGSAISSWAGFSCTPDIIDRGLGQYLSKKEKEEIEKTILKHERVYKTSLKMLDPQKLIKNKEAELIHFILKELYFLVKKEKIDSINLENLKNIPEGKKLLEKIKKLIAGGSLVIETEHNKKCLRDRGKVLPELLEKTNLFYLFHRIDTELLAKF